MAGGASRADVAGQVLVRAVAWLALIAALLLGERPSIRPVMPLAILLAAATGLVLLQLVPLPPDLWQALPGREPLAEAMLSGGGTQPWRPLTMTPGVTINAASSLIVPIVTLFLLAGLHDRERAWLPGILLGLITAATLIGLVQFSGASAENPFVNDTPGHVSGNFANRNHFALFMALGCVLAPAWAFLDGRQPGWRAPVAFGLVLLFALTILATGSRAGLLLGAVAIVIGLVLARHGLRGLLQRGPRWLLPVLIGGIVATIALFVLASLAAGRADAIDRFLTLDPGTDMRRRGLPTVMAIIGTYFPVGSGIGGFDPVFRMHEPFDLLKPTYFNHAHNDFLEIALDAGVAGLAVLLAALGWWAVASVRVWRRLPAVSAMMPRLGSVMLLLMAAASVSDYPVRTPMMMAMLVIAGWWLSTGMRTKFSPALPHEDQHL